MVGNTLYWFDNDLDKREWLEGRLIVHEEIFGKREYLNDDRFIPSIIHSCSRLSLIGVRIESRPLGPDIIYLNFLVFDVSPRFQLDISVVSIQKYPMDHDIEILDALLL